MVTIAKLREAARAASSRRVRVGGLTVECWREAGDRRWSYGYTVREYRADGRERVALGLDNAAEYIRRLPLDSHIMEIEALDSLIVPMPEAKPVLAPEGVQELRLKLDARNELVRELAAALDSALLHDGRRMTAEDRRTRLELVERAARETEE